MTVRKSPRSPEELLPLTEATFQLLLALADRERHGYGIMHEVELRTAGRVRLGAGTLYGALKRLVADGLVEEAGDRADPSDTERRRYYRLSPLGRATAKAEARRLAVAVRLARGLRLLSPEVA
jgi:DNA-binding PadR family transcriptional regulator